MTSMYRTKPFKPSTYEPQRPDEFTLADYAEEVGLSPTGAWKRLERLRKAGEVTRRRTRVDEGPATIEERKKAGKTRRPYFLNLYTWIQEPKQ